MKKLRAMLVTSFMVLSLATLAPAALGGDLPEVRKAGVLRHLGIPYANFVTGSNDGMDVELVKGFAKYLGVRYEYVKTGWETVVQDLIGKKVTVVDSHPVLDGVVPVRGDLIANGFTILPWRQEIVDFSDSTFPSQIWLIARAESSVKPIKPSPLNVGKDIARVREAMNGKRVLAVPNTCLDPRIYGLAEAGATVESFTGNLNELAPAVINGKAEMTILDVPDALIALEKWPGKIKIIGPISPPQTMAVGFPKSSPRLREAFNKYLAEAKRNGKYLNLVKKYYPTVHYFFPDFFKRIL